MSTKRTSTIYVLLTLVTAIVCSSCAQSSQQSLNTANADLTIAQPGALESAVTNYSINIDEKGRALRGYDPISYFADGAPVEGSQEFSFEWNEAEYYFATAENRDKFIGNPGKYAPANGGYCTFGVVLAKKFDGDPTIWSVHKDRLYVFLNREVQEKFLQDEFGNLRRVAENWPIIQDKSPEELAASS
ncbi:MAG: YHS domain-containing (seleno)protein [Cyanobacteria bacterium P01_D01_bin.156]